MRWARAWAMRCVHESLLHEESCFVTLTYDQDHVPRDGSLRKRDWQLFAKRLRRLCGPFRFFAAGEYGSLNRRPHYHALLFGMSFRKERIELASGRWTSPTLMERWGQGQVDVGDVSPKSAAYVASYSVKKQRDLVSRERLTRYDGETGEYWEVAPEFVLMSRRPGLGSDWIARFKSDVYPADEVVIEGTRDRPPRFYDSRLPEAELEALKGKRAQAAQERGLDRSPDRLRASEVCLESRLRLGC